MAPEQWKALKLLRGLVTSLGKPGTVEVILPDDFGIASGKSEKIKVIGGPAFINRLTTWKLIDWPQLLVERWKRSIPACQLRNRGHTYRDTRQVANGRRNSDEHCIAVVERVQRR